MRCARSLWCLVASLPVTVAFLSAQPVHVEGGVAFRYPAPEARSVSFVGDFNGWSREEGAARREGDSWTLIVPLHPGIYQYKVLVDGTDYRTDPSNPATIGNYNGSGRNSVFVLTDAGDVVFSAEPPMPAPNPGDIYPASPHRKPLYLNIIWHQHQPLYVDPSKDQLQGPWVRTHATKDYYDMAALVGLYPDIHCTINLTSSLLYQLREFYLRRLGPFVDTRRNRVDAQGFLKRWKGKTDPWIDLALTETKTFGDQENAFLCTNTWNAFGMSEVMMARFPEYLALKKRLDAAGTGAKVLFSFQEMRTIKFLFFLAYFDPDFLAGPVRLTDGTVCDLSDYVHRERGAVYRLTRTITEDDCNRIVAEAAKVMANVIPAHRALQFDNASGTGQIEIITTPFYHPILPLIFDSDLARVCQPADSLPPRFAFPSDADAQVAKAVRMYRDIFQTAPTGMWPGEGSVAQPVLGILRKNGILWTASDVKVLHRSRPAGRANTTAFSFPAGDDARMALVFRDTELSDRIGFKYQNYTGEDAAEEFVQTVRSRAPESTDADLLLTVILDGENAWEWYRKDEDGKTFLAALYRKLSALSRLGQVKTVTPTEYLHGNPVRGIPAHPVGGLTPMEWLYPGSWINGNFDTWIGEPEENTAWAYLLKTRQDLAATGIPAPDPLSPAPATGSAGWNAYMAWEEMYAAEGSDWFWWYGSDQQAPAGDQPFDVAFRAHLANVYAFAGKAGAQVSVPVFAPVLSDARAQGGGQGTMAKSRDVVEVLFTCNAKAIHNPSIAIAGNLPELGSWVPNAVVMYDDGTHGDAAAGDGIWSLRLGILAGTELQYKYTNSGKRGAWVPGEEFAGRNRTATVPATRLVLTDTFGQ